MKMIISTNKKEDLMDVLGKAVWDGALKSVVEDGLRNIHVEAASGTKFTIVWYCNVCTLKTKGFSMQFDGVAVSTCHPSFNVSLNLYNACNSVAYIGHEVF